MDNLLILSLLLSFQNSSYILKRQYWTHFFSVILSFLRRNVQQVTIAKGRHSYFFALPVYVCSLEKTADSNSFDFECTKIDWTSIPVLKVSYLNFWNTFSSENTSTGCSRSLLMRFLFRSRRFVLTAAMLFTMTISIVNENITLAFFIHKRILSNEETPKWKQRTHKKQNVAKTHWRKAFPR